MAEDGWPHELATGVKQMALPSALTRFLLEDPWSCAGSYTEARFGRQALELNWA